MIEFFVVLLGAEFFYCKDAQANIVALLDSTGAIVVKYNYDAWGMCVVDASTTNTELANLNPFRYRSYYFDTETGFYFLKTRYLGKEFLTKFIVATVTTSAAGGVYGYFENAFLNKEGNFFGF